MFARKFAAQAERKLQTGKKQFTGAGSAKIFVSEKVFSGRQYVWLVFVADSWGSCLKMLVPILSAVRALCRCSLLQTGPMFYYHYYQYACHGQAFFCCLFCYSFLFVSVTTFYTILDIHTHVHIFTDPQPEAPKPWAIHSMCSCTVIHTWEECKPRSYR